LALQKFILEEFDHISSNSVSEAIRFVSEIDIKAPNYINGKLSLNLSHCVYAFDDSDEYLMFSHKHEKVFSSTGAGWEKTLLEQLRSLEQKQSVEFFGNEYKILEVIYFGLGAQSLDFVIYVTEEEAFVEVLYPDTKSKAIYLWENFADFMKWIYDFKKMEFPQNILFGGTPMWNYIRFLAPIEAIDCSYPSIPENKVDLNDYQDITELKANNINSLKNSFSEDMGANKNIVLTYFGLFDLGSETDVFSIIENAEKLGKKQFVVYNNDDCLDAFLVNNKLEASDSYLDRHYMLPMLMYFEDEKNAIEVDGKELSIIDKVYFLEEKCGLIALYLTENGVYAEMRTNLYSDMRSEIFSLQELLMKKKEYDGTLQEYIDKMTENGYEKPYETYYQSNLENFHNYVFEGSKYSVLPPREINPKPTPTPTPTPIETVVQIPELTPTPEETAEPPITENEPQNNAVWIIVITIALAIILGGVALVIIKNNRKK